MVTARPPTRPDRRRRRGLTLLELLLAAGISATACTAAAMLLAAVTGRVSTVGGLHAGASDARDAIGRISLLIEQAPLLGFRDAGRLLIWRADDNGDSRINRHELTLLRYDADAQTLSLMDVRFPTGTASAVIDASNTVLSVSELGTAAAADAIEGHDNACTWAVLTHVSSFAIWSDAAGAAAELIQLTFTVTHDDGSQTFHAAMTPRGLARWKMP